MNASDVSPEHCASSFRLTSSELMGWATVFSLGMSAGAVVLNGALVLLLVRVATIDTFVKGAATPLAVT